jgi:hypothetical protein
MFSRRDTILVPVGYLPSNSNNFASVGHTSILHLFATL